MRISPAPLKIRSTRYDRGMVCGCITARRRDGKLQQLAVFVRCTAALYRTLTTQHTHHNSTVASHHINLPLPLLYPSQLKQDYSTPAPPNHVLLTLHRPMRIPPIHVLPGFPAPVARPAGPHNPVPNHQASHRHGLVSAKAPPMRGTLGAVAREVGRSGSRIQ